jgi:uridylate cyclase
VGLKAELAESVRQTFAAGWTERDGQSVPESDDLKLTNDAVKLDGTVLYADLTDSTALVTKYKPKFAAEIYKTYLYCAAKIIRSLRGTITAYDGDRVMAVFIDASKNSNAAKCGLMIDWTVKNIIQPAITKQYPTSPFKLKQVVGIDTSSLFIARTGIRGSNDLVWVGRAANYAAKMAALSSQYPTYVSADTYARLKDESKFAGDGRNMWTNLGTRDLGIQIYGSAFWWPIS